MQSKTFTYNLDTGIAESVLRSSGLQFTLDGTTDVHSDIVVEVSNASLISVNTVPITPAVVEVVFPVSYTITIQVSHPTSTDIDDLTLTYITDSWKQYDRDEIVDLERQYKPLDNFYDGSGSIWNDINYNSPFRTANLNLDFNSKVDAELQFSYDGSVNIIFTDDVNPVRLVNTRWILQEDGQHAKIGERRQTKDTNTYSDENFHRTELIPSFKSVSKADFLGLLEVGKLDYGGYRYFFRYVTSDGAETNIIEETRLIEVHKGTSVLTARGGNWDDKDSGMAVELELTNLDSSYYGIRVYYTYAVGDVNAITTARKISSVYVIEGEKCNILHTGYEPVENVSKEELNVSYSLISSAKTLASANDRLLLSNVELIDLYDTDLSDAAASVTLRETNFPIVHSADMLADSDQNYSNPIFTYNNLGYWRGETYELGIVFTSDEAVSPVYPVRGIDNLDGSASYDALLVGNTGPGFFANGENSLGVYRTSANMDAFWSYDSGTNELTFDGTSLRADITKLLGFTEDQTAYDAINGDTFYVVHDAADDEYYLNGVFGNTYASLDTVNVNALIPTPTGDVVFTFTNSDGTSGQATLLDGTITVRFDTAVTKGTNMDNQSALQADLPNDYSGFFFVRRRRKPDKLAQGIITPTAAIPTVSSVMPDASPFIYGNYTGIGVQSDAFGRNVTYIPAPACCTPWGVENMYPIQYEIGSSELAQNNYHTDFIQRAPVLTYDDQASWSFYSPDVDTNPVYFATKFNGGKFGLAVDTEGIQATFTMLDDPPIYNEALPTRVELNATYGSSNALVRRFNSEITYTESGSFNPSIGGFSAKNDRNLCISTTVKIKEYNRLTFDPFDTGNAYPAGVGVTADPTEDSITGPKLDSMVDEARAPSAAVNYGRYLGLSIYNYPGGLEDLNMDRVKGDVQTGDWGNTNWQSSLITRFIDQDEQRKYIEDDGTPYGMIAYIFESSSGRELTQSSWKTRYSGDEDSVYYAITERYSIENFTFKEQYIDLYGGDCYAGLQWKQVWSPMGISGFVATNDLDPFRYDRTALGLLDYGFAIPVPAQSNSNFNIRKDERANENEYKVYGKDRTYLPGKVDIRGDRLMETGNYNKGYTNDISDRFYNKLNVNTPFIKISYPNRVYNSDVAAENQLWNGFTVFNGLNFKDYNSELGAITKIVTVHNYTYLVFHHGIAQVGVNERSMISTDTGGVFTESFDVLSSKSNVITADYGSQHLHSIVASANFLYGVDVINKKIWRTSQKGASLISDFKVQSLVTEIIDEMQNRTAGTTYTFDVNSSYDLLKGDIFFTFGVRDESDAATMYYRTIVFNEVLGIWITETDDTRKYFFKSGEDRYSFPSIMDPLNTDELSTIYKYYREETNSLNSYYNKFYGDNYNTQLRFNVIENALETKIFENLYIVGNKTIPYSANYMIEDVVSLKDQIFVPSTNVAYTVPTVTMAGTMGDDYFTQTPGTALIKWDGEYLGYGDFISIPDDTGTIHYFVCMGVVGGATTKVYVNKILPTTFTDQPLNMGYRNPIRLATSIYEDHHTKLVIKTRAPKSSSKLYIPRGKWLQVRLDYDGMAPMYIENILSSYSVSYS